MTCNETVAKLVANRSGEAPAPILVSACLLGEACRYDGASVPCPAVAALAEAPEVLIVPICPEQLGGLPTPRIPSEIQADGRIVDRTGVDRSAEFAAGAREALRIARQQGCKTAILKAKSPSCGVRQIYDGTFTGSLKEGRGATAALLARHGIALLDETDVEAS